MACDLWFVLFVGAVYWHCIWWSQFLATSCEQRAWWVSRPMKCSGYESVWGPLSLWRDGSAGAAAPKFESRAQVWVFEERALENCIGFVFALPCWQRPLPGLLLLLLRGPVRSGLHFTLCCSTGLVIRTAVRSALTGAAALAATAHSRSLWQQCWIWFNGSAAYIGALNSLIMPNKNRWLPTPASAHTSLVVGY